MSAELLRRAATKLRETAAKATREPWTSYTHPELGRCASDPTLSLCIQVEDGWVGEPDLDWIALMSPVLAEPLASWLEFDAGLIDDMTAARFGDDILAARFAPALTVARTILAEVAS